MSPAEKETPRRRADAARLLAAALACGCVVLGAVGLANGQTVDGLNAKITDAKSKASSLAASVQSTIEAAAQARQEAAAAAAREAELTSVLARGEQREAALQAQVEQAQAALQRARAQLHRALAALSERLVAIYESDPPSETEMLLNAHGLDDLENRADLLGRIQSADQALAERVKALKARVTAELARVTKAHEAAVAFDHRVAAARDQISAVRANAEARAAALDAARQEETAAIQSLNSQVSSWEKQVQHLQAVSAAQAQQTVGNWLGNWAIPEAIVMCESGGNFRAVNPSSGAGGAYQILPSTWRLYGGQGLPEDASPAEQSRIAAEIWADSGPGAWVCAG
jgi:Transglycosylase-like domain